MTRGRSNQDQIFVSLVIPAYNEEKRIKDSLIKIQKYLEQKSYITELIVVDDGSKDKTLAIARECLDGMYGYRTLTYEKNRGKGYAVKTGVLDAKGMYIVFLDADLSTPIEELDRFLKTLEQGYDIVIGTRKNKEARVEIRQPLFREFLGKGFTLLSNIFVVKGISDITCGFKGFKREVGRDIFKRLLIDNWSFDAEILFLSQKLGYKIKEIPVTWYDAEGTKVRLSKDVFGSLKGIFQIQINSLFKKYKIKNRRIQ
ncbi:MAG: dolichyl-phosphate beta-glucosyltransferase [Thermodesulfobacteriota bacterium]|nr:dolichyl-phosphate beta-glucosyltransferase [Thermodesulfobacteriota bacterium]